MKALPLAYRQVHLDFHTSEQIAGIGRRFDAGQFADTLLAAHVNSITCFSKCHHGMIYHDTRFEARHPFLQTNLLQEQVEACHARGIRVPIYISVGLDEFMAARHPEWIELGADGKRRGATPLQAGWKKLCFNTPYIDYVWEQTLEVLQNFAVDGLFFDIIHQGACCCGWCLAGMRSEGVNPEDESARKAYGVAVLDRTRRTLTDRIRAVNSDCLIFWNSGHVDPSFRPVLDCYSHLELESLPSGGWGYDHFPLTVRYARNLGLDHLGMTGKFHKTWAGFGEFKNRAALEYECFTALAEGSKCSIGDQLHPNGELDAATYQLIGGVYAQVEAREPWCIDAVPVTEIAIFNPEALGVHDGRVDTAAGGAYRMLLEGCHQFDVVDEEMDWNRYRVLILADKIRLSETLKGRIERYLDAGGRLIASFASGLHPDRDEFALSALGVASLGLAPYHPDYVRAGEEISSGILPAAHVMYERGLAVEMTGDPPADSLAEVWHPYFNRTFEHFCSHRHTPPADASGSPAIVETARTLYFSHPIFGAFMRHGLRVYKQLFLNCLDRWLPNPLVRSNAPTTAHITVMRQKHLARTVVHVLHYIPEQRYRETPTIEDVIPLYDIELSVRLNAPPSAVYIAPERRSLNYSWDGDRAAATIPQVHGHVMVVFEDEA